MKGKLRNMSAIYILYENKMLLLYQQGGRVVNNVWTASAGGHFEENEVNDAKACVLRELEEETGILVVHCAWTIVFIFKADFIAYYFINELSILYDLLIPESVNLVTNCFPSTAYFLCLLLVL